MAKKKHEDGAQDNGAGSAAVIDSAGNTLVPAQQPFSSGTDPRLESAAGVFAAEASHGGNGQPAKSTETKEARFKRLANARFPKALKALKALTNLSNRAQYAYTEAQAETLLAKVFVAVDEMQAKFRGATEQANNGLLFE